MHTLSIPGLPKDIPNNPKTIDNLAVHRASNLREGPHPIPQQGVLIINIYHHQHNPHLYFTTKGKSVDAFPNFEFNIVAFLGGVGAVGNVG